MKTAEKQNKKLLYTFLIYTIIFYFLWSMWEFFVKHWIDSVVPNEYLSQLIKSGISKNLVWTLPALCLIKHFNSDMYIGLKEMFTTKVSLLKYLPVFLIFTVYLLSGLLLEKGKIAVSETFSGTDLIICLFVGITEETVFRGWLLNSMIGMIGEKRKWISVIVNALMFLLIHFPIWIYGGTFVNAFTGLGFIGIILLSFIFSWTLIKSRNIFIPISLHMYWDLLMFIFY